jgi:hypothetical protein
MKRAAILLLSISLTLPAFAQKPTNYRCVSLEHIAGAWRMEIQCDQSHGAILMLDGGKNVQYVGQGMFKGMSRTELTRLYQSLIPKSDSDLVLTQLG